MNAARAFGAGVIGALVLTGVLAVVDAAGIPLHIETNLAELFGAHAWFLGFVVYLVFGGICGLFYGALFEIIEQSGIGPGLLFGGCHAIMAGFIWAMVTGPGPFWFNIGLSATAILFLVHLIFGAIVGALYRPVHVGHPEIGYGQPIKG